MMGKVYHIKRLATTILLAIVAMVMVTAPALADKSKKRISRGRSAVPTEAIKYATPTIGAVEFIVNALGQQRVKAAPTKAPLK